MIINKSELALSTSGSYPLGKARGHGLLTRNLYRALSQALSHPSHELGIESAALISWLFEIYFSPFVNAVVDCELHRFRVHKDAALATLSEGDTGPAMALGDPACSAGYRLIYILLLIVRSLGWVRSPILATWGVK